MNDETKGLGDRPSKVTRYLRSWLYMVAAVFAILLFATRFLPVGPWGFDDWLLASLLMLGASLATATVLLGVWLLGRWLCRGRNLKRIGYACACLIPLLLLFYAEEDLRGWLAWTHFKHKWEAKGERFDLRRVVPPPVPDDENFAMTDIAFTSYGQTLTRDGKPIPPVQRDSQFVVRMRMPLAHDFAGQKDLAGDRVRETFTNLEGWQRYYRRLADETNDFPVSAQAQSPAADVLLALSKYDRVIEELRAASRLSSSRYPVNYDSESPWAVLLPHLAPLKGCAQVLQLRSAAELLNGQPEKALDDVRLALQLTDKVHTEPFLISHLVRIAMVQLMLQPVWEGLAEHAWDDAQLVALDAELAKFDFVADYLLSMRSELGAQGSEMDRLRRRPAALMEMGGVGNLDGHGGNPWFPGGFLARLIPTGWFYQNQLRCARTMVDYCIPLADASRGTFSADLARRGDAALAAATRFPTPYNLLQRLMLPALSKVAVKFAYAQASVGLARTAIALERCRLARGAFPESLDALAPQFLDKLPHGVIGGQPLKYRREANSLFVLYSVGWNEKDDAGVVATKKDGYGSLDLQSGDWIWRYPSE